MKHIVVRQVRAEDLTEGAIIRLAGLIGAEDAKHTWGFVSIPAGDVYRNEQRIVAEYGEDPWRMLSGVSHDEVLRQATENHVTAMVLTDDSPEGTDYVNLRVVLMHRYDLIDVQVEVES